MLRSTLIALLLLKVATVVSSSGDTKVTTSVKDVLFNGIEGLNINIIAPFQVNDYTFGFKYALTNVQKLPDILFAKTTRSIEDGDATIESYYDITNKVLNVITKWVHKDNGVTLVAEGDNVNKFPVTSFGASREFEYDDKKVVLKSIYNVPTKSFKGFSSVDFTSAKVEVDYDSLTKESILSVVKVLDNANEVIPSISLLTGNINYSWLRKWDGGSLKTKLIPGKLVNLLWKDKGSSGIWTTNVKIPLQSDEKCSLSLLREWNF